MAVHAAVVPARGSLAVAVYASGAGRSRGVWSMTAQTVSVLAGIPARELPGVSSVAGGTAPPTGHEVVGQMAVGAALVPARQARLLRIGSGPLVTPITRAPQLPPEAVGRMAAGTVELLGPGLLVSLLGHLLVAGGTGLSDRSPLRVCLMGLVAHLAVVQATVHLLGRYVWTALDVHGPRAPGTSLSTTVAGATVDRRRPAQVFRLSPKLMATQATASFGARVVDLDLVVATHAPLTVCRVGMRRGAMALGAREAQLAKDMRPVSGGPRDGTRTLEPLLVALSATLPIRERVLGYPAGPVSQLVQ